MEFNDQSPSSRPGVSSPVIRDTQLHLGRMPRDDTVLSSSYTQGETEACRVEGTCPGPDTRHQGRASQLQIQHFSFCPLSSGQAQDGALSGGLGVACLPAGVPSPTNISGAPTSSENLDL